MPGYAIDTLAQSQTQPWGTSAFNGLLSGPTASGFEGMPDYGEAGFNSQAIGGALLSLKAHSAVGYAGAASDLGGGSGSWSSPTNADGAPDGSSATWTAP